MITFRPNPNAAAQYRAAILQATKEIFELDIHPEAVRTSPVTPEGLQHNLELGKKGVKATGTGHNRQSIDYEVEETDQGPVGKLYTQSGYGAFLELGTRFMRAQPFLWPSLQKFISKIATRTKEITRG